MRPIGIGESLPEAGCLVQRGARALTGAIPDEMWQSLLFIGGRLRKRRLLFDDLTALRQAITLIKFLAVAGEELSVQVTVNGCSCDGGRLQGRCPGDAAPRAWFRDVIADGLGCALAELGWRMVWPEGGYGSAGAPSTPLPRFGLEVAQPHQQKLDS